MRRTNLINLPSVFLVVHPNEVFFGDLKYACRENCYITDYVNKHLPIKNEFDLIFMDLSDLSYSFVAKELACARDFALKIAKENNKRVSVGYFCENFDGLFSVTPDGVDFDDIFKNNDIGIPLFVERLSLIHNSLGVVSSDKITKTFGFKS